MGVMRLLPALVFVVLLGGPVLVVSDLAHAQQRPCGCNMSCPGPNCYCDYCNCFGIGCSISDSFENYHSTNFQIRSVHSPLFTTDAAGNDLPRVVTLLAMPQEFVKLQCQRLKEMLSWVSDLH